MGSVPELTAHESRGGPPVERTAAHAVAVAFQQGLAAHRAGDFQTAENIYRDILAAQPDHAGALHFLGLIYSARGDHTAALELIERSLRFCGTKAVYWNNYGAVLKKMGRPAEARAAFGRAIALRPEYADAWSNLGLIHLEQGEWEEAESCLRHALRLAPRHADALRHLARVAHAKGETEEAVRLCRDSLAAAPRQVETLTQLGEIYCGAKRFAEAAEVFRRVIAARPDSAEAHLNLGLVYNDLEEEERAREEFRTAAGLRPDKPIRRLRELSLCPTVFDSTEAILQYRAELERRLDEALAEPPPLDWRQAFRDGFVPSFQLYHHGVCNRGLREKFARLFAPAFPKQLPTRGPRPDKTEMPGVVVLDLYDTDQSGDQSVTVSVPSGAGSGHALRAPEGPDALVAASLEGGSLTISVPQGSTAAGLTAVTVVGKDADGLPVAWTVLVHVVAVEGYTVEEQAWGETAWDAPEDSGEDWALLWQCNDYRWLPQTTFDGLVTAADWGFASMTVDSSRERWAYGTPGSTGVVAINPVVTFGGQNIYFETLNTAVVGLHETGPSTTQPRIAVTYLSLVEWEPVAWSREVEIEDYGTSVGLAKLTSGEDGHLVYPDYRQHPVIQQPIDHNVVRVKVQLGAPVPEGMLGTVHLAWYDPDNTVANVPAEPPANPGDGLRDNAASLAATGGGLPAFTLAFTTAGPSPTSDSIQKAYLAIEDARYGDNFIVAVHPHSGIAETFEFRENESQEPVLMRPANTGLWTPLPDDDDPGDDPADAVHDHRTSVLTIMPSVDIDTDSDNTGVIDRSDGEDYIEASPAYTGNVILINADDDNNNGAPDWADEPMNSPDDDLHPIVLEVCLPDASSMAGFELHLECTSNLSLWQDQSKNQLPLSASELRLRHYKWTFGSGMPNYPSPVYVEGLNMGRGQVSWALRDASGNTVYSDSVVLTVTGADLDADSDNNNSLERSLHEDQVEDAPGEPGKIIRAALRDDADHDRIPDFADGYDRDGVLGSNDDFNCGALASLVLDVFPQIDPGLARFKFAYGASDPASVTQSGDLYIAAPGNLRIWKKDASVQRNKLDAATGGDYVAPNVEYTASDLGLSSGNRVVQFYLEGINPGVTTVTLLTDMDGPSGPMGFIPMDTVKVMVVYVDLDVNNNGALFDAVDGVDYYLPGYEGTTDKLTFNRTFNTISYMGQHMKLIADGVGSGQGIDAVSFRITNTTSLPGYAENKTAYMVTGPVRNDDYSFALTANSRAAFGTMAATNTFADFYCKDYGGSATVVASLIKNGVAVFTWTLDVPTDTDQDGLADRWERQQIAEWNTQYGYSHDVYDLTFVRRDYDWEMADPDASNTDGGTDLPAHKTTGDSLTEFQEYRGFILDGGNSHAGGHRRLSTSRKELLVEVDIMEGVEHMPTEAGIRSTMNTVSAGFGDLTEGAGIDLYYVIDEPTASHRDFSSYAQAESWANAHRHRTNGQPNMLTKFVYLAFADSMAGSTGGFAGSYGAFVVVDSAHDFATNQGFNVTSHRAYVAAHELTHMIIDTHNANGFNGGEHLPDPNENGVQDDADDGRYLMYHHQTAQNTSGIHFSNPTLRQIDLTSKESVER